MTRQISMSWPEYSRQHVRLDGKPVHLTVQQTEIVSTLLMHRGNPVSVADLVAAVYRDPWEEPELPVWTVRVQVSHIRAQMPDVIETNGWLGYSIPRVLPDIRSPVRAGLDSRTKARRPVGPSHLLQRRRASLSAASVTSPVHAAGVNP